MALDIQKLCARQGPRTIAFLDYCVRSVQMDPLFTYLARDYQLLPSAAKAIALYHAFCAPNAPARISVQDLLPPFNQYLFMEVSRLQNSSPPRLPPKSLFDALLTAVETRSASLKSIRRNYRVRKTAMQNLPDGKMSSGQRFFVEKVWQPNLRPRLVNAGFWRIRTIA